jgi:hypothetical protein
VLMTLARTGTYRNRNNKLSYFEVTSDALLNMSADAGRSGRASTWGRPPSAIIEACQLDQKVNSGPGSSARR